MGSRGVSGYTYSRKVQLAKKIASIDRKLAKIEEKATKEAFNAGNEEYKRMRKWFNKKDSTDSAKSESNYIKGHSMAKQGAGKLRQLKKQYTKELSELNAGQLRMFR